MKLIIISAIEGVFQFHYEIKSKVKVFEKNV